MNTSRLDQEARNLCYTATRQFDAAVRAQEIQLLRRDLDPVAADYRGVLILYLRPAVSVGDGIGPIQSFLHKYRQRPDLPFYLDRRLAHWQEALTLLR